jgi:hypothetical protein
MGRWPELLLACLAAAGLPGGCCLFVHPPDAKALLDVGFRSPEQTFRTLRTAWGANLPDLEYRCLSVDYTRRHGLSQLSYREYRERLRGEQPWIKVLSRAELVRSEDLGSGRHRVVAKALGTTIGLELVREDVLEMWSGEEFLAGLDVDFERAVHVAPPGAGQRGPTVRAEVPVDGNDVPGVDLGRLTELRVSREWKIDDFYELPDAQP